jgi:predicted MFS family arabinose efflux permease
LAATRPSPLPTLVVLVAAYELSQFYRSFLAVIAPELARDLALTAADLGRMQAAWSLAFALAQIPVGWALDKLGPRVTVSASMLAAVAGAVLFGAAAGPGSMVAAMALIGLGCSAIFMGALVVVGRLYPPERFAAIASMIVGIGSAGNLFAATPLAALTAWAGWRGTMTLIGVATLGSALAVWLVVRDPPRAEGARAGAGGLSEFLDVLRLRALWPIFPIALVSYAVVLALRGLWVGPYFADVHGLDPVARGNAVTAMVAAMTLGAFAYGPLDRWFGTRKWVVVGGAGLTILPLALLWANPAGGVVFAAGMLAMIGGFGHSYGVLMAHARAFVPDHLLGRGITLMNLLFIGGVALLQVGSGILVDRMRGAGAPPAEIYQGLFGAFALILGLSVAVYLAARDAPPGRGGA